MFPIVVLLALSGLVVGMLNSFEHFAVPALAPVAWNLVIIAALVGLVPVLPEGDEIYAYAIGILAGTVVQFLLPLPWLRGRGGQLTLRLDWRDARVRRVLKLMLPVTIALGLINLSLLINSLFGDARLRPGAGRDRQGVPRSTSCRRGCSRSRSRRSCSRRCRASPRAAPATTCAARWATACARSACC